MTSAPTLKGSTWVSLQTSWLHWTLHIRKVWHGHWKYFSLSGLQAQHASVSAALSQHHPAILSHPLPQQLLQRTQQPLRGGGALPAPPAGRSPPHRPPGYSRAHTWVEFTYLFLYKSRNLFKRNIFFLLINYVELGPWIRLTAKWHHRSQQVFTFNS